MVPRVVATANVERQGDSRVKSASVSAGNKPAYLRRVGEHTACRRAPQVVTELFAAFCGCLACHALATFLSPMMTTNISFSSGAGKPMKLSSDSLEDGKPIPAEFAFCKTDPAKHATLSENRNPHLAWDDVPPGTKSFALICHDVDVPSKPDDLFKEDREIPASLPRVDFYHWVLVDIPPTQRLIEAGSYSKEVNRAARMGRWRPTTRGMA